MVKVRARGTTCKSAALFAAAVSLLLLGFNVWGQFMTLRPAALERNWPDSMAAAMRSYPNAIEGLGSLEGLPLRDYVRQVNTIVHQTLIHLRPQQIEDAGYSDDALVGALNMRVPIWENYLLYALSFIKPDTYRRYEFCSAQKALERGIGECGQQSLTVVDLLNERGIEAGFIDWSAHHVVAVAKVAPAEWYILDPDYNVTFPYLFEAAPETTPKVFGGLAEALLQSQPDRTVIRHPDGTREMRTDELYKSDGQNVSIGGPNARWGRACPIERLAYILKWLLPGILVLPFLVWVVAGGYRRAPMA
jgi:hypothetical protein